MLATTVSFLFRLVPVLSFAIVIVPRYLEAGDNFENLPWHLARVEWEVPKTNELADISIDCVILQDVPDSVNLFVVPINSYFNEHLFYFGSITNLSARRREESTRHDLGRGLMFSKWNDLSMDAIRPSIGGYFMVSDHEGKHVSVRSQFKWSKGYYTFKLVPMEREPSNEFIWVGAYLYSHNVNETSFVGAIRFPGRQLHFDGWMSSFVEIYDRDVSARPKIPQFAVAFGNIKIGGRLALASSVTATYEKDVPKNAVVVHCSKKPAFFRILQQMVDNTDSFYIVDVSSKPLTRDSLSETLFSRSP
jgi:hypothetical protein